MQIGSLTYSFVYQYDLAGDLVQETYPSGRVVNTAYDLAQRPLNTSGVAGGTTTNYVQSTQYYPHGAPQYLQYASNLWWDQSFSKTLQSQEAWSAKNNNSNTWMYIGWNGLNNNETVSSQTEGFGNQVAQNMTFLQGIFRYDNLNRMTKVSDTSYLRYYIYDEYGNLTVTGNYNVTLSGLTPTNANGTGPNPYDPNTNHIVMVGSGGYEARGNITTLGAVTMGYDAESRLKSSADSSNGGQSASWIYDAEGQRAEQIIAGGASTIYVHDAFGNLAAEYNNLGVTPACTTCYLTYDMLGTVRMVTDQNQALVARHDFIPFGEEIISAAANRDPINKFGASGNVMQQFTGQEADGTVASLHYFNARHLAGVLGGFVQPDPENAGGDILNPQSWNGYGYVMGNPMGLTDPSGLSVVPCTHSDSIACVGNDPDFASSTQAYNLLAWNWMNANQFLNATSSCTNCGPSQGGSNGKANPPPAKSGTLSPMAQTCENKIQTAVDRALDTITIYLHPTVGRGMNPEGLRNGAYNFDYFATGVTNPVAGSVNGSGRFRGSGLHIPLPGGEDPTIPNWGAGVYKDQKGSYLTAHYDSANPLDKPASLLQPFFNDVLLRRLHGC